MVFTSRSRPLPAASRIAPRLAKICSVCSCDRAAGQRGAARLERELAGDEHEVANGIACE